MTWPWRKSRETLALLPPAGRRSRYNAAALQTFLEQARATAAWHEARANAIERKAGVLLGFVGVILVLMPTLRGPIANAHGHHVRMALVGLAITAAILLALAALSAAFVLMPRGYAIPGIEQLRNEWKAYVKEGDAYRRPEHLTGLFIDQLIRKTDPSPLISLRDDAKKRAWWMERATWLVVTGVLVLGGLTSMLLVEGGG
jgi:hypothetical protein